MKTLKVYALVAAVFAMFHSVLAAELFLAGDSTMCNY